MLELARNYIHSGRVVMMIKDNESIRRIAERRRVRVTIPKSGTSRIAVAIVIPLVAFILSGCTPVSHVSATLVGSTLTFANCENMRATRISVYAGAADQEWADAPMAWRAVGDTPIRPDEKVAFGHPPDGFANVLGPVSFEEKRSRFEVSFFYEPDRTSAIGDFEGRDLIEGKWLRWDGSISKTPCN